MPCRQVFGVSVLPQRHTCRGSANLYMQPFFKYLFGGAIGVIVGVSAYTRIFTEKIPPAGHLGTVQLAFEVVVAFLLGIWVLDYFGIISWNDRIKARFDRLDAWLDEEKEDG